MKKTAIKGMSLLFVLFVVAAFATGVQAQDAADNENTTAGYAALGAGVARSGSYWYWYEPRSNRRCCCRNDCRGQVTTWSRNFVHSST